MQNIKQIDGDLYFDFFRFGSFYNEPDSIINKFKQSADTVNKSNADSGTLNILAMYEILKKENLLYNPFVDLKLDNDSIAKIYFDNDMYKKIVIFKRQDLIDAKKKIRIKLMVRDLGYGMFLATELISIDKVDGQTYQMSKKLKIDDYH